MTTPDDPRLERYRPLSRLVSSGIFAVGLLAVLALAAPAAVAEPLGAAMVVFLAAIPLLRVAWLVGRWFRRGDPRFALLGLLVISVPVIGLLLAT